MSMFESELENLLGEFHIKMKGEIREGMTKHSANKWEIFFFWPATSFKEVCVFVGL